MQDKTTSSFQPHFIIAEHSSLPMEGINIEISQRIISYMIEQANFRLADITINVSGEHMITDINLSVVSGHRFPISGFPRALIQIPPPIRRLFREISLCVFFNCLYHTLTTVKSALLKENNEATAPAGPEASTLAVTSNLSEADHSSDYSSVEGQTLVSDDELKFKSRNSPYQAFSTLRRPDMVPQHAEFSSDGEEW